MFTDSNTQLKTCSLSNFFHVLPVFGGFFSQKPRMSAGLHEMLDDQPFSFSSKSCSKALRWCNTGAQMAAGTKDNVIYFYRTSGLDTKHVGVCVHC